MRKMTRQQKVMKNQRKSEFSLFSETAKSVCNGKSFTLSVVMVDRCYKIRISDKNVEI